MTNLDLWNTFSDIDPKFTKPITGKAYKGTSPNPQYIIMCLTELFGPVGRGFGWTVEREEFTPLGNEVLHWCRVRFWHTSPDHGYDAYGQTKAVYTSRDGKVVVDEDAPKKSLTDAIIKAASQIGIAANIFLGRWDDQKYVAQVNEDFRADEAPKFDARAAADRIIAKLRKAAAFADLKSVWDAEADTVAEIKSASAPIFAEINAAKDARKTELQQKEAF